METRFLADSMLGRLAKWLRVMGYDTHYQTSYNQAVMDRLLREGRRLVTRDQKVKARYPDAFFIEFNHVDEQLNQLKNKGFLRNDTDKWFTRCLVCNTVLIHADPGKARERVPEYVYYHQAKEIKFCPSCLRYFWPGTHRERMKRQLNEWGF